jgi:L-fuculose-phosphate aldolase
MPGPSRATLRAALVKVCRRLADRGLVAGAEGNVSVRLDRSTILVTPGGARKGDLRSSQLVAVDLRTGRVRGRGVPSTEIAMHLAIYRARPDIAAVVHAHPPTATGFAVARKPFPQGALAEIAGVLGPVPLVAYAPPGSEQLGSIVADVMLDADAALLANHGAVTLGTTLDAALNLMESLEQAARILVSAHILGGVTELGHEQVLALDKGRRARRGK